MLATNLETLLADIESGQVSGTATMRYRIEGAVTALRIVQGKETRFNFGVIQESS